MLERPAGDSRDLRQIPDSRRQIRIEFKLLYSNRTKWSS
jgi:hypothetical protein